MFCKRLMLILLKWLSLLLVLHCCSAPVQAQGLGFILEAPETAVVAVGSTATFSCSVVGNVFWQVRGRQVTFPEDQLWLGPNFYVPLSTPNRSEVFINATNRNNGSTVICLVERPGELAILNTSTQVELIAYGAPSPPSDLNVTVPTRGLGVWLTWRRGFTFEGEEIIFIIAYEEISSRLRTETRTSLTSAMLFPTLSGTMCQVYNFTIFSENEVNRSSSGVAQSVLLPAEPVPFEEVDITVSLDMQSVNVLFEFDAPSPCAEFSVDTYTLTLLEIANSRDGALSPAFNVSRPTRDEGDVQVSLMVSDSDDIRLGSQYNVTIIASNSAGSSAYVGAFYTTGLQSSQIVYDGVSANITCVFAVGATALGCHVSFGSVHFNMSHTSNVAVESVTLPQGLPLLGVVAEILDDGNVSSILLEPLVVIIVATTSPDTPFPDITTATSEMGDSTSTFTPMPFTTDFNNNGGLLSGSTLYIIIGVIVGIVLLLLLIIIVVVCVIKSSHHRNKNIRSFELSSLEDSLKPNYVYGGRGTQPHLTASTDLGGLENTRQVRSNTYDDPRSELATANGTTTPANPTYETIQSAKNGMLIAGGPPVLNPVYGPTGTPNTPTSPHPPPSKAAPNPVYAESGNHQQLPDVSALNPVYAPIGKPTQPQPALDDPTDPRYANTQSKGVSSVPRPFDEPPSLKGADSAGYPPPAPMYEELRAIKPSDSLAMTTNVQMGDTMTRNESYGLLGMENITTSQVHPQENGDAQNGVENKLPTNV